MKISNLVLVFILLVPFYLIETASASTIQDGPVAMDHLGDQVIKAFLSINPEKLEESDKLDALFTTLNDKNQKFYNGRQKISAIFMGLNSFFLGSKSWDYGYRQIKTWKSRNPKSAGAAIAEAIYWQAYARHARGNGYASTVTPEGWQLSKEYLKKSEAALLESKDYAEHNVLWHETYLIIAIDLNWNVKKFQKLFEAAIKKEKTYYPFYFAGMRYFSPQWGGDYRQLDQFVKKAAEITRLEEGHSFYARLYGSLAEIGGLSFDLFKDSHAKWVPMKAGFEDMMQRYPQSKWNLNLYAYFACRAGDRLTFSKLRAQLGSDVYGDAWPSNYSIEICERRFFKPT